LTISAKGMFVRPSTCQSPVSPGFARAQRLSQTAAATDRSGRGADRRVRASQLRLYDDVLLVDSTPVECARSVETSRRSQLGDAADYGYCARHSRFFWSFRLHAIFAMDGTPRSLALTSPKVDEKTVCLQMVAHCERQPGQMLTLIGDKHFHGQEFEADLAGLDAQTHRPRRRDKRGYGPHLAPIRGQQPPRPPRDALRRPRRRRHAQSPLRPTKPLARLLQHLTAWHNSSSVPQTTCA
jgi:Transposase DDE domain